MRSFLNVLRGGRGRGEPGKEEMKRGKTLLMT